MTQRWEGSTPIACRSSMALQNVNDSVSKKLSVPKIHCPVSRYSADPKTLVGNPIENQELQCEAIRAHSPLLRNHVRKLIYAKHARR